MFYFLAIELSRKIILNINKAIDYRVSHLQAYISKTNNKHFRRKIFK